MASVRVRLKWNGQIDRDFIASSNLRSAGVSGRFEVLEVEFLHAGEVYRYYGVSQQDYDAMLNAGTPGQYFYHHIRLRYPYVRIQ